MELDRPNRPASAASTATTTSDLFICFTSRLSHSSSMRMSSKSILSPGRSGDNNNNKPPISLQSSLSRRMRTNNGSLKGAQSPMFPPGVTTKKRGCAFENPEPSSPKVTCIGQVRVKTKKQGKKMKMNMKAYTSRSTGEVSFRRIETEQQQGQNRNQSWGQLPLTICDALKEFSCFIPCRSSSCGGAGEGEKQGREDSVSSSSTTCGGAVYRWLVAFHGEGRTRDIELVVGEEEGERREEEEEEERECSRREVNFDDMDFNVEEICEGGGKEEGSRVSICVPPKNALLLMRCRSDPVKMSALANKLWESPPTKEDKEEEDETEEVVVREETEERRSGVREDEKIESFSNFGGVVVREEAERRSCVKEDEKIETLSNSDGVVVREEPERRSCVKEDEKIESLSISDGVVVREEAERRSSVKEDEKIESFSDKKEPEEMFGSNDSIDVDEERISVSDSGDEFVNFAMLFEEEEPDAGHSPAPPESTPSIENQEEEEDPDEIQQTVIGKDSIFEQTEDSNNQPPPLESQGGELEGVAEIQSRSAEQSPISVEEEEEKQFDDKSRKEEEEEEAMKNAILPDCLLLMMCEPKLSMEVSEETWVCSTDFLRPWLPERHRQHQLKKLNAAGDEPQNNKKQHKSKKNRGKTESNPPLPPAAAALQPPRSSCSFPISMASLIEKKLGCAVAYEPFVLTRCKSEPMRTASARLGAAQELACFWKNSKIEPHRPANCGIGAAGVGF